MVVTSEVLSKIIFSLFRTIAHVVVKALTLNSGAYSEGAKPAPCPLNKANIRPPPNGDCL